MYRRRGPALVLLMQSHKRNLIQSAVVRGELLVSVRCLFTARRILPVNKAKYYDLYLKGQFTRNDRFCHLFTLMLFQGMSYFFSVELKGYFAKCFSPYIYSQWGPKLKRQQKWSCLLKNVFCTIFHRMDSFFKISLCSREEKVRFGVTRGDNISIFGWTMPLYWDEAAKQHNVLFENYCKPLHPGIS